MESNTFGLIAIVAIGIYGIIFAIYLLKELRDIENGSVDK
jgi:hypothetical protein